MMKPILRICLKLLLFAISLLGFTIGYVVFQLETSINDVLSSEQQDWIFQAVEKSEELPPNITKALEANYPDFFNTTFWQLYLDRFTSNKRSHCQCEEVYLPFIPGKQLDNPEKFPIANKLDFKSPVISLELEERFTQKQCYFFSMNNAYFGNGINGIKNAALNYYNKTLADLSEREILELNIIRTAPTFYDPIKNPDRLKLKLDGPSN